MKRILLIGAGRSANALIKYLLLNAESEDWFVRVGDMNGDLAASKVGKHSRAEAFAFDALDYSIRLKELENTDLVISMLPANLHYAIAQDCVKAGINLITPSYITPEMAALDSDAKANDVIIINELGVDPGLDHMSAMQLIDRIKAQGGELIRFESFTGGLVAPESDNNPWGYKFTWNPRNVVLAGQGGSARFLQGGLYKYIPYFKVFERVKPIEIKGHGMFEGYANRDSLKYRKVYGIENIPTIYRGTLRKSGFSKAWNVFVQMGMTQDDFEIDQLEGMTKRQFTNSFLSYDPHSPVEEKMQKFFNLSEDVMHKMKWLGLFDTTEIGIKSGSPAKVLQHILEEKWHLEEDDKDMIVMWHRFNYTLNGKESELHASMVYIGEDQTQTAMAKTVGLPLGIAAKMVLNNQIKLKGVQLPIVPEIYNPILEELKQYGIVLEEAEVPVSW